jgi:hypothetical protein
MVLETSQTWRTTGATATWGAAGAERSEGVGAGHACGRLAVPAFEHGGEHRLGDAAGTPGLVDQEHAFMGGTIAEILDGE